MQYLEESERPWGKFQKFFHGDGIWVKRLEVYPRSRLSLQKHRYRVEKWIIVQGQGMAIINGRQIPVAPGQVVDIPLGTMHRMWNPYEHHLIFIEIAYGGYLAEDDIIRMEDDYNRVINEEYSALIVQGH